jgi:class 3 adenylate cyclase
VAPEESPERQPREALPASFASGRYAVRRFLGEGAKKRVFEAHDTLLDRDVAVALVRTEGLDTFGRQRVTQEAQALGRLGAHPNIVSAFDLGEHESQPFIVTELMASTVAAELREADGPLLLERTLAIVKEVCKALEFAHGQNVIHRDLKPSNVCLSPEGTAKISDFGLAISLDKSRLTQQGMIVGTVAYMPPEQALGGDITPRSDLYALGAMLYELVSGRPPFLGDDPTAVISQHINVAPVAPSWYTEHCPPDLEELILRLLQKDPAQRPESATEVLAALERVDPAGRSASHSESNVLDRLARGVFVGREQELRRLHGAFDEAFAGRGGIVMLVGEPGIGKTRAAQELETYARMRGALVLWGRAHESAGAPAYWPWTQAGNGVSAEKVAQIGPDMQGKGPLLAPLFSWLREQPNFVEPEPLADAEAAQFRLFDAYATFVRALSNRWPVLIALDDVHWADKASLLLLQHVARDLSRMRVLIVCTYRDTELSRTHPLSETLASLNREATFDRVALHGLLRDDVLAYIRGTANMEPQREIVDRIYEETEGNPFFLTEVVNLMAQEGKLGAESVSDIAIPDGVKEALGRRLDRISPEANELLQTAAVVGREFTYDMLTLLGERDDEALLKLIEEALEARVIEEMDRPGRYRFTHALMQETLLGELSTTRRVRLHGNVGEALEHRWGERADERASRLALHFLEAATLTPRHAAKAMHYSKLAAHQAEAQAAWSEAALHYESCLTLLSEAGDGLEEDEAAMLTAQGHSLRASADIRGAWRSIMRALTIYRERADGPGFARAFLEVDGIHVDGARLNTLRDEAIAECGDDEPYLRARILAGRGLPDDMEEAADLARRHEYKDVQAQLLDREAVAAVFQQRDLRRALALAAAARRLMLEAGEPVRAARLWDGGLNLVATLGSTDALEAAAHEALADARQAGERRIEDHANLYLAVSAWLRCDFDRYEEFIDRVSSGYFWGGLVRVRDAEQRGHVDRALDLMPDERSAGTGWIFRVQLHANRARVLASAGKTEAARLDVEALAELLAANHGPVLSGWALFATGDQLLQAFGADHLRELYDYWALVEDWRINDPFSTLDVTWGEIALVFGLVDEAGAHFRSGLDWSRQERWPVEEGRCLAGLADVAERRGDAPEALRLLDQAAALFRQHGANLFLDGVIARKLELQGVSFIDINTSIDTLAVAVDRERPDISVHAGTDGKVTLMFSDIQDSTPLAERIGDEAWVALLHEHNAIFRQHIAANGGHEVKTIGDAFMVAFQSPPSALKCAVAVQAAFAEYNQAHADQPLRVRIGLHTGDAVRDEGDFYGTNVILASRLVNEAGAGEILASSMFRELVEFSPGAEFGAAREVALKGLSGVHQVWTVERTRS